MSQLKFAIIAAIIGVTAVGVAGAYFVPAQTTLTIIPTTQEEQERNDALGVAQGFILTSPTFAFDGISWHTEYVGSAESFPPQYMIKIAFDSAHGGFGNREGQMLTQVITPHKMDIIVSEGIVISAVTDETWDEMNHQYVLKKPSDDLSIHIAPVHDYDSFIEAMSRHGTTTEFVEELGDSSFSVPVKIVSVDGEHVQVFEFSSATEAQDASLMVSEDGTEIGTSIIRWIDAPHFYTQDKLIVLYVGHNQDTLNLLDSLLDKQFAGM